MLLNKEFESKGKDHIENFIWIDNPENKQSWLTKQT